jgi:hypothetical protein
MGNLALEFEKQIIDLNGIVGTSTAILTFTDGSQLQFQLETKPKEPARATGLVTSLANGFALSVMLFTVLVDGFEFTFSDGSKLTYDLMGIVLSFFER